MRTEGWGLLGTVPTTLGPTEERIDTKRLLHVIVLIVALAGAVYYMSVDDEM